jgi:hypothetical protein
VPGTVQHGGNLARDAYAASGILGELALTGLGYDYFRHLLSRFFLSGTDKQLSASSRQLSAGSYKCKLNCPAPFVEASYQLTADSQQLKTFAEPHRRSLTDVSWRLSA